MNPKERSVLRAGILVCLIIAGFWPFTASAQSASDDKTAAPTAPAKKADAKKDDSAAPAPVSAVSGDEPVKLSPFVVSTDKDRGYAATNSVSGSRVNTAIKDIPIPIQVITSEFISDIGATDLRKSLSYVSGITLQSQNDLENSGATYGTVYGPGGVNNPEGVTSNANQVQVKIRGFITNNTLRDGFLRGNGTDSVNIERVEVVSGPNALLYGTGNFGGVVDYLTNQPQDKQQGSATVSYGTNDFKRATLDVTGPISTSAHLDYRVAAAWEDSKTNIDFQKNSHNFVAPTLSWTANNGSTVITAEGEYGRSKQNGYGFRALRAVQGNSATPINNDQLEAVSFYYPPGANPRTFNLSGPDTYNNQQASNFELKGTQLIHRETEYVPEINFFIGYNHSVFNQQSQNVNGQMAGPITAVTDGAAAFAMAQTIVTYGAQNGLGGQSVSNGNLVFGTLPGTITKYQWGQNTSDTSRDQERVELTMRKSLFEDKWYHLEEQVLGGFTALRNDLTLDAWSTTPNQYSYKSPNDLTPIRFGKQGDGSADPALFQSNKDNINIGWDSAYYLNSYLKALKLWGVDDRIIIMNGIRTDKNDNWSTNTNITAPGAAPDTTVTRSNQVRQQSAQNGIIVKLTKGLSVYALRSVGFQPNFGTLHDATTGQPVGAETARSEEIGIKLDLFDGKLSGTISKYKITKTGFVQAPWFAPAPLGHPKFDPAKPIVYNLEGGFNAQGVAGATLVPGAGNTSQGAPVQTDPTVISAWNAAVAAGAITHNSPLTGQANDPNALYINASTPTGAAYLDAAFASVGANGGAWPGWLYQGNSIGGSELANINNATLDAGGFQNGALSPAYQVIDQAKGVDMTLLWTPNDQFQLLASASLDSSVYRVSAGKYPNYPGSIDRWASWFFPNGGFGLQGSPVTTAYTNPADLSTHVQGLFPGDDTPKTAISLLAKYKFDSHGMFRGLSVGLGGNYRSKRAIFSGITHGAGQAQYNSAGQLLILYAPDQYLINGFATYTWKSGGYEQYVQLNVDNLLNDTKLYGLIYQSPLAAKISYGIKF
jgi:outer membrane receptor protein involved in Fe transport